MDWVLLAARLLFALIFVMSGINHLRLRKAMAGYTASKGVPAPQLAVVGSGLVLLAGGVLVALGAWVDLAGLLLAAFLLSAAALMHDFWKVQDPMARMNEMAHFQKDVALAGAALGFFYLFNQAGPAIGLTIGDGRLFGAF